MLCDQVKRWLESKTYARTVLTQGYLLGPVNQTACGVSAKAMVGLGHTVQWEH
jgi:hypothetical protein